MAFQCQTCDRDTVQVDGDICDVCEALPLRLRLISRSGELCIRLDLRLEPGFSGDALYLTREKLDYLADYIDRIGLRRRSKASE